MAQPPLYDAAGLKENDMTHRWHLPFLASTLTLASCGTLWTSSSAHRESMVVMEAASQTGIPVPPSFLGHPLAYAAAVFGQLTVFSVSWLLVFSLVAVMNLRRDSCLKDGQRTWASPINVYRVAGICFMVCTGFWAASNLIVYLTYHEVTMEASKVIYTIEKGLKAAIAVPFLAGAYLLAKNDQEIVTQLAVFNYRPLWQVPPYRFRDHAWMFFLIFALASLVTYAKWQVYLT